MSRYCIVQSKNGSELTIQTERYRNMEFNNSDSILNMIQCPPSEGLSAAQPAWIFLMAMRTGTSLASILTQSAWANGGWLEKLPGYPHFTCQKNIPAWSLHHRKQTFAKWPSHVVTIGNSWQQHQQTPTCWRLIQSCHSNGPTISWVAPSMTFNDLQSLIWLSREAQQPIKAAGPLTTTDSDAWYSIY